MDIAEQIVTAILSNWALILGLILTGTWVVKTFFPQLLEPKKLKEKNGEHKPTQLVVQLDPEVSRAIHETAVAIRSVSDIVERKDEAGTPLVYADRRQEHATVKLADAIKDIAEAQKHLADSMARLDARFEAHDKSDSITFSRLADTMIRIEAVAQGNKEAMIIFGQQHAAALKSLDEIKSFQFDHDARVMKAVALQEDIRQQMITKGRK